MSIHGQPRRLSTASIRKMKGGDPIVCLTSYTTPMTKLVDPHCDLLLVGDSVGMVVYGMENTVGVTVDMMVAHGSAVMRAVQRSCVIVDLPFGSYQGSKEQAFANAARLMKETGCDGVKLEGGEEMAETVSFLARRGIPVFGHVGLMPQLVNVAGGFRSVGHSAEEDKRLRADAAAIADAGAFAIVIEGTVEPLAREITNSLSIPTIGIGASPACDGQILVVDDILGLYGDLSPRFVKRYAELSPLVSEAVGSYAHEVRKGKFPGAEHTFKRRA